MFKIINSQRTTAQRGFTIVETLFYTAGIVVLLGAMVTFIFYTYNWYRNVTIEPRVDRSAIALVEKIVKDIRTGSTINSGFSSFNTNNGSLSVTAQVSSADVIKYFYISNGRIAYTEDGGSPSYLTPSDATASRFYLVSTSTNAAQAIHFDVDFTYMTKAGTTTKTYTGLGVLRQSYE